MKSILNKIQMSDEQDYSDIDNDDYESDNNETDDEDENDNENYLINKNNNQIPDNERITYNKLTKYEKTGIIGERIKQLCNGSTPFVDISDCNNDIIQIATKELNENKIPLKIIREYTDNFEIYKIEDLIKIDN